MKIGKTSRAENSDCIEQKTSSENAAAPSVARRFDADFTSLIMRFLLRATKRLGRSAYGLTPTPFLRHIFGALEMLSHFLIRAPKTSETFHV
ncbi:MAG: hypothetical protein LBT01_06635, partial [Spirochaetaceae bacterium]|nr:hypothetical protein [Spirochaetaceae bacterium]